MLDSYKKKGMEVRQEQEREGEKKREERERGGGKGERDTHKQRERQRERQREKKILRLKASFYKLNFFGGRERETEQTRSHLSTRGDTGTCTPRSNSSVARKGRSFHRG